MQSAMAQQADEEEAIEEVVATGTRLKGTATGCLEERKNQAFCCRHLSVRTNFKNG